MGQLSCLCHKWSTLHTLQVVNVAYITSGQHHIGSVKPGQRVLLVDDLVATGGTLEVCVDCPSWIAIGLLFVTVLGCLVACMCQLVCTICEAHVLQLHVLKSACAKICMC